MISHNYILKFSYHFKISRSLENELQSCLCSLSSYGTRIINSWIWSGHCCSHLHWKIFNKHCMLYWAIYKYDLKTTAVDFSLNIWVYCCDILCVIQGYRMNSFHLGLVYIFFSLIVYMCFNVFDCQRLCGFHVFIYHFSGWFR